MLERLDLEGLVPEGDFRAQAAAGGERDDFVGREGALGEDASISRPTLPVAPTTATL